MTRLILALVLALLIYPQALSDPPPLPEPIPVVAPKEEVKPIRTEVFEITAYSYSAGSRTSTGTIPHYGTIAADPRILPYGTKLYIPEIDYYGVVSDCGGAIKDYRLDLFFETESECIIFGRQWLEVQILEEGE